MLGLTDREMLGRLLDEIVSELTLGVALETVVCTGEEVLDLLVGMTLVADVGFLLGGNVRMVLCAIVGDERG